VRQTAADGPRSLVSRHSIPDQPNPENPVVALQVDTKS